MVKTSKKQYKSGGVSIFVVAITALIISVMVLGFIRIMNRDNAQSSRVDISQSAYDSAQAGVEDAKRFLERYVNSCAEGVAGYAGCSNMKQALESEEKSCNMLNTGGYGAENGETKIQSSTGRNTTNELKLDQAYTCVKIYRKTDDYLAEIGANKTRNIMLKGDKPFNKVKISWYSDKDLSNPTDKNLNLRQILTLSDNLPIEKLFVDNANYATANQNVPPVIRAQFMGFSSANYSRPTLGFNEVNSSFADDGIGFDQRIYYPSAGSGSTNDLLTPTRRTGSDRESLPRIVRCRSDILGGGYACSVEINLGHQVMPNHVAMMKLTSLYAGASYKVELVDNINNVVKFDGVQPKVDSTGRANNAFRRVESRVEFSDPNFPGVEFSVYTEDKLCKKFWTTKTRSGSVDDLECR